jgi:ADP-ribose pyrophosphatase YjhB (NUDIX family)
MTDHPGNTDWPPGVIDPGGPTDPALGSQPVDDVDRPAAFTLMAPGWYPPESAITQSYGFGFTPDGLVVLVQTHDGFWNLPGGQLEAGETARDALVREVAEEACARVIDCRYLACQHVWDPQAPHGPSSHYQTRWWARLELDAWEPHHEIVRRLAIPPDRVLATLSWRSQTIAARLLEAAVVQDRLAAGYVKRLGRRPEAVARRASEVRDANAERESPTA